MVKRRNKGGFLKHHVFNPETDLDSILKAIPEYSDANSLIYVSVGSKHTEDVLTDMSTDTPPNSIFQMIPYFLYNDASNSAKYNSEKQYTEQKVLNIIIDDFRENDTDEGSIKNNLTQIERVNRRAKQVDDINKDNINIFIINVHDMFTQATTFYDATKPDYFKLVNEEKAKIIQNIIEKITERVAAHSINPKNYMVCNYVKFKHPNEIEQNAFHLTIAAIHKALSNHGYTESEYNWFGYSPVFYNFIYQGIPPSPLPNAWTYGPYRDKDNIPYTKYELLYKHNNTNLSREGELNVFLQKNADKIFLITNPHMYDNFFTKTQNNFTYSLKDMRDELFR